MSIHTLRPWTELVSLHPDVESGTLAESVFAIDLGAIAAKDSATPKVYLDADAFFGATFVTTDLYRLLEEVLASLAGQGTYNRVLKLRSPFGGGKSHTLASLLHAARSRKSLNQIPSCRGLANPGSVDVSIFDGEKFTALGGKEVEPGRLVHTMWGWLAWQIGPRAYEVVARHDEQRVSPQGDEIQAMLAAEGRPVLVLLDEVLKYMEAAGAAIIGESTLQRQALNFLQNLTVEVANSRNAVLVYSLQWSARQAMGNLALLQTLDTLVSRVDQVREPVTGDEVLSVIKTRLLAKPPDEQVADEVAKEYVSVVGAFLQAHAETSAAKLDADSQTLQLGSRLKQAYPFHPSLIDVMNSRWTSVDDFQRTRGSLRFLAACLHALKKNGGAKPLLGPGDINLADGDVRNAMLKDLDPTQAYDPVIKSDIAGPNARAKRIDDRYAKQTPALANVRPALRLATAVLAYSFGGLKRGDTGETLPPGVTENELLAACIGPDLDNITASAVLSELRNSCLYLHFDGVRYCFKKDPNVTKLIEDAEQEVTRDTDGIRKRIKELLDSRLAGRPEAIVWPTDSNGIDDKEPRFLIGYLPLEFTAHGAAEQTRVGLDLLFRHGDSLRSYRNGIALAIPDKNQVETLRRAVRYLAAVERVERKKSQLRLTKDQEDQLKERKRTEESAAETAFRLLYSSVWLPRIGNGGALEIEPVDVGGRPLQATTIHERVMELLTKVGRPKVHGTVKPHKIVDRMKLGEALGEGEPARMGVSTQGVCDAFFGFLEPPRILSDDAIRKAICSGIADGVFAYCTGSPTLGPDGKYQIALAKVLQNRTVSDDEIDLDSGFLIAPDAVPLPPPQQPVIVSGVGVTGVSAPVPSVGFTVPTAPGIQPPQGVASTSGSTAQTIRTGIRIAFPASRDDVFKSFQAIANLADKSDDGKIQITVEGQSTAGYDANWLRNAVQEPLEESDIKGLEIQ